MLETYQQLLQQWAALAPDECSTTDRDYRFKVKVLPQVEKCSFDNPWRSGVLLLPKTLLGDFM